MVVDHVEHLDFAAFELDVGHVDLPGLVGGLGHERLSELLGAARIDGHPPVVVRAQILILGVFQPRTKWTSPTPCSHLKPKW